MDGLSAYQRRQMRIKEARQRGTHTKAEWEALILRQSKHCARCDRPDHPQMRLTKDHIVPVSQGGSDAIDNLQALCWQCNARKGAKPDVRDRRSKMVRWRSERAACGL